MLHFSQSNPQGADQGDVAVLLARVADSIKALGDVHIHDMTFHNEIDDAGKEWPTITVYYSPEDK